jgi:hypothetical protein
VNEHEHEPVRGLPEYLPDGEQIVWQGAPDWRQLALHVFHVRKVAIYFVLLAAIQVAFKLADGASAAAAAHGALWLVLLGVATVLILGILAWLYGRTTIYTMTSERLVLRFGVALPMMINLPWKKFDAADLVRRSGDSGDLVLTLAKGEKLSYWLLWPHARPWRFAPVQPSLRCLADVAVAADRLRQVIGPQAPAGRPLDAAADKRPDRVASGHTAAYS